MKLNLLPKTIGTENRSRNAAILGALLILACGAGAYGLVATSSKRLARAKEQVDEAKPKSELVVAAAASADTAIGDQKVKNLVVNAALAKSMIEHNYVYPKLYADVLPYIPGYFRLTQLSATPIDGTTATLNMTGRIKTFQEYADLMLALMRIPGAQTVGRAGFQSDDIIVPAVTAVDQNGRPRKASEGPIPDDALDRLAYFEQKQNPQGYLNSGNFGSGEDGTKTITPGSSLISVSVVMNRNIQTPNPRATLAGLAGGGGGAAAPASMGAPGGPPMGAASAGAPMPPGGPAAGRGRNGGQSPDDM